MILNSATYRQEWRADSEGLSSDTNNRLLWRFDRRRLSAEELRDSALMVSGQLDLASPGAHPFNGLGEMSYTQHKPFENTFQHDFRSIYLMTSRIRKQAFLTLFDGANPTESTGQRHISTVPLQALYLLNNPRFHEFSNALAERIEKSHPQDEQRIATAFQLVYLRPPSSEEKENFLRKIHILNDASTQDQSTWQIISQALLVSNEFSYLD